MANATIGALRFELGANTAAFEQAMKGAEATLRRVATVGAAVGTAIGNAMSGLARSITEGVNRALHDADKLFKLSQTIGMSVEALSALRFAADLSGVSLENLGTSLTRLGRSMAEALSNNRSTAARTFEATAVRLSRGSAAASPRCIWVYRRFCVVST